MNSQLKTHAERRPARISLRLKLTLLAVALSSIPMAIVTLVFIDRGEAALELNTREHFFTIVDKLAGEIGGTFDRATVELRGVGFALVTPNVSDDNRLALAKARVAAQEELEWVAIYDASGSRVDTIDVGETPRGRAPATIKTELISVALADDRALGPIRPEPEGLGSVLLVLPIRGERATWFVASEVGLDKVQAILEKFVDRRFFQDNYAIYVADGSQRAVAHTDRELAEEHASLDGSVVLNTYREGLRSQNDVVIFRDRLETPSGDRIAAIASLPSLPWILAVEIPRDVAYQDFARMRISVLIVVIVVVLLAIVAAVFLSRRITQPIQTLVSFASDLAARRFDQRVVVKTRDELSILGNALSDAATQLEASDKAIRNEVEIRADLGRYLPSQLVDKIVSRERSMELGGERREITVLFADVAGFTPLVETEAAEDVVTILNELFSILTEIVFAHGGTVDKFVGDCVMAIFGAPDDQADHAAKAVAAAEDMLQWLEVGNDTWRQRFGVNISLAIGVHTGEAVVGNFGSETRMEYTAIGDVVNVAARLETRARPSQILISAATRDAAGPAFNYVELGKHRLAGRKTDIELFEVST